MMSKFTRAAALLLLLPFPALAQDAGDDWDLRRERDLTVADAIFDSGLGVGVRCQDGGFGVVIVGLPPSDNRESRILNLSFGDAPPAPTYWIPSGSGNAALAELPAPLARRMRAGGRMNLVVPDGAGPGRNLRYALDLPRSASAIDTVMQACGKPADDPRDARLADADLSAELVWTRQPRPEFPSKAWDNRVGGGMAFISCLTTDEGAFEACEIESEHPMGAGFGRAGVRAMRRARVGLADPQAGGALGGQMVIYVVRFGTFDEPGTGATRLSDQRRRAGN